MYLRILKQNVSVYIIIFLCSTSNSYLVGDFQAVLDVLNFYDGGKYQAETNAKFMTVSKPYGR